LVLINTPDTNQSYDFQIVYDVNSHGFSTNVGMPMYCTAEFQGDLYFGTVGGAVARGFVGRTDGELIDGTPGQNIEGELQTAWNALGAPEAIKRFMMVQPFFLASDPPSVKLQVNTDWKFTGVDGSPGFVQREQSLWDIAVWDKARWAGGQNSYSAWAGAAGIGHFVSLRMAIRGEPGTVLTNWVVLAEQGGIL
jgi:hypothetical protein